MVQRCGLAFIPVTLVVIVTLLLSITFTLAVAKGDVAPFFPYLSFLGSKPPACYVFTYLLYASALLGSYVRYKLVRCSSSNLSKHTRRLNIGGFVLSILAGLGMSVVGTARITEVYSIHMLGAGLFFWPSTAYCVLQTVLSYLMLTPRMSSGTALCRLRLALCLLSFVSILTCLISSIVAGVEWSHFQHPNSDKQHWQKDDGGYVAHLVSAFSELSMVSSFILYFLTFVPEFRRVRLNVDLVFNDECTVGKNTAEWLQNERSYHLVSGEESEEEGLVTTDILYE